MNCYFSLYVKISFQRNTRLGYAQFMILLKSWKGLFIFIFEKFISLCFYLVFSIFASPHFKVNFSKHILCFVLVLLIWYIIFLPELKHWALHLTSESHYNEKEKPDNFLAISCLQTNPECFLFAALGAVPSPLDCYLCNRGLKTLHVRMEKHFKNGMAVAQFLESNPGVEKVIYPGMLFILVC